SVWPSWHPDLERSTSREPSRRLRATDPSLGPRDGHERPVMGARWLMALALLGASETAGRGDDPEEASARALTQLGAKVTRDAHAPGKPVVAVDLSATHVSDGGLAHLRGLANLQTLDLTGTRVTDAGLEHLQGLANLRRLFLQATPVTDTGL